MDLFVENPDFFRRGGGGLPKVPYMPAGEHARTWITFFVVCVFVSALLLHLSLILLLTNDVRSHNFMVQGIIEYDVF
jgi:hypothetical protein